MTDLSPLAQCGPDRAHGQYAPILVAHMVRISGNVGSSVGILYFVNTLGSAVACLMCAIFIMRLSESPAPSIWQPVSTARSGRHGRVFPETRPAGQRVIGRTDQVTVPQGRTASR